MADFFNKSRSDGLREAVKLTYEYYLHPDNHILHPNNFIDVLNFINALRFCDYRIHSSCDIEQIVPKSTRMRHPIGIVIGNKAEIGENVQINQNVTIGGRGGDNPTGHPKIRDNVTIYSGSVILGDITLHEGCTIGANSVVLDDVEEEKTAVGAPAKEI
jgi:serine acetyltransferase